MPKFSVIVPTFGRPRYVLEAIDSVLAQTVDDFELIVVDDGSPEPVSVPNHAKIRVVRLPENVGQAAARNAGVGNSSGDVLTFLDDDDTWSEDRLELARQGLTHAPIAVCWQAEEGRILTGNVHDSILDTTTPSIGATAIDRSVWLPMDESYRACEDLLWWLDITLACPVATVPVQGLHVRSHPGPRDLHGPDARAESSHRLLAERSDYFASHRAAAAFRWKRIGLTNLALGDRSQARNDFRNALRLRPSVADAKHYVDTFRRNSLG